MNNLNQKQREMLLEAIKRKNQRKQEAGIGVNRPSSNEVSADEYQRRLREKLARDQEVIRTSRQERISQSLKDWESSVGPRFAKAKIENPRVNELVTEKVSRIKEGRFLHRNGLVLSGIVGGGKTWTAYAYARMLVETGALAPSSVVHGTEASLLLPLTLGYDRTEKIHEFLNRGKRFYIIDDSGVCNYRTAEHRYEVWFQLVNHAYENHIPLVITTSMSTIPPSSGKPSQLAEWIGEAAYDRLKNIADVVVPSESNKRGLANSLLDKGEVHGMEARQELETSPDPFAGIESKPKKNPRMSNYQRNIPKAPSDLRPPRR